MRIIKRRKCCFLFIGGCILLSASVSNSGDHPAEIEAVTTAFFDDRIEFQVIDDRAASLQVEVFDSVSGALLFDSGLSPYRTLTLPLTQRRDGLRNAVRYSIKVWDLDGRLVSNKVADSGTEDLISTIDFSQIKSGTVFNSESGIGLMGNVGIGTTTPDGVLTVQTDIATTAMPIVTIDTVLPHDNWFVPLTFRKRNLAGNSNLAWTFKYEAGDSGALKINRQTVPDGGGTDSLNVLTMDWDGNVGIGKVNPQTKLDVGGMIQSEVLRITGGSDLAEPFDVTGNVDVRPGMLVAIDPDVPGHLKVANRAYMRTVAGVISGANGLNPGLTLRQDGGIGNGSHLVALSGRVYCRADASYGEIAPGDLLTSSATPGHAMKAKKHRKSQGAVIGKAMSGLDHGRGFVLVLVNLQ